jgi:hypothetical protein
MARDASYYKADGNLVGLCHIRVVENPVKTGDLAGTNLSYAEVQEVRIRIIFDVEEMTAYGIYPARNDFVVMTAARGYVVDNVLPADGMTVSAEASRMSASELAGKTLPESVQNAVLTGTYWSEEGF